MTFSGLTSRWMMPGAVGRGERLQDRVHDVEGRPRRERALGLHHLAQGLAGDVLHGQEHAAVVLALVEDGDDVGVATAAPPSGPRGGTG